MRIEPAPPRLARLIARWALPEPERSEALVDLDAEYARRASGAGRAARGWYWRQALGSVPFGLIMRRRRRQRASGATSRTPITWSNDMLGDIRYAFRLLLRRPGFALAAIVTLGLGLGTTAAVTTVVHGVLLRPLPYGDPDRLVSVRETHRSWSSRGQSSYPDYVDWTRATSFEQVAGHTGGTVTMTGEGAAERVSIVEVTTNFFDALGVRPRIGRSFEPEDGVGDGPSVVLITDAFWRQRFGADPAIVGRTLRLNGQPIAVIGVLAPGFAFPPRGDVPIWAPLFPSQAQRERRYQHWLDVIGLLAPGVTARQARDELAAIVQRAGGEDPRWHGTAGIAIQPLRDMMVGDIRPALLVLLGATVLVLLIAVSNVAGLLLARATARGREFGVRLALGATRVRVYRQILTEAFVIAAAGAAAGLLVARGMLSVLVAGIPARQLAAMPHLADLSFDWRVVGVAMALAALAAVGLGAAPARRALGAGGAALAASARGPGGSRRDGASRALVLAEIALAVVLLTGATLLARSFGHLMSTSPGFEPRGLVTFRMTLPPQPYSSASHVTTAHGDLLERFARMPGVERVATINQLPLTGTGNTGGFVVAGDGGGGDRSALLRTISDGYLEVQDLPLENGRAFDGERPESPRVVIVNRALADAVFPQGGAVGERIEFTAFLPGVLFEIVGVVGNEQFDAIDSAMAPVVYFPYSQSPERSLSVIARTSLPPATVLESIRGEVQSFDAGLPIFAERTMASILSESRPVFLRRYLAFVISVFAATTVLLAAVGLYGLLAGSVAARAREIGIRQALGATRGDVLRMVIGQGFRLALAGAALGIALALALSRFLESLLFGVTAADPLTFVSVPLLLLSVALAACWVPARRALDVEPATALRME
jgi:putative ABC transport system permease protein